MAFPRRIRVTPLRRRVTGLAVFPLWIIMVLTGGQWCLMPGSASAHPVVSSAPMVGHAAMTEGVRGAHSQDAHAQDAHARGTGHHAVRDAATDAAVAAPGATVHDATTLGATMPSRPASEHGPRDCESQAACSVAIAPAPVLAGAPPTDAPPHPRRLRVDRLLSRTQSPELPPPRA
ncbi:MAG TPA: hypothetical protein VFV33_18245 [Gemmatimonadaceae bacterium]|nr:hypothetical protein [Gemmatimonadaceae bacterium]